MATRLIQLEDGILVEAESEEDQPIAAGFVEEVNATFDKIKPVLIGVSRPVADAWKEISKELDIEQAEVTIHFSFEGEGNLYVTKAKAGANLSVKMVLKPKN